MGTSSAWTPERRARQAEAIRRWQPWAQSSGPKTAEGKAVSSRNADKGGHRVRQRAQARHLREMGRARMELILLIRAAFAGGNLRGACLDPAYHRSEAFVAAQARYERASAAYWRVTWRTDDPGFRLPVEDYGYDLPALAALVVAAMGDDDDDDPVEPQ
jgi:hypothetical protein